MEVKIKIDKGKTEIILDKLEKNTQQNLYIIIQRVLFFLRGRVSIALAAGTYGIKTQGGRLMGTMESRVSVSGTSFKGELGPTVIYGPIQEEGGVIRPVRAKALRFVVNGEVIFAKRVTIPAHWYMRKTLERYEKELPGLIKKEMMKL